MTPIQTPYRFALNDVNREKIIEEIGKDCSLIILNSSQVEEELTDLRKKTPFGKVLEYLLVHDPTCFFQVISYIDKKKREKEILWLFHSLPRGHTRPLLTNALETLIQSSLTPEIKSLCITSFLQALPQKKMEKLYEGCKTTFNLSTLCQFLNLIDDIKIQKEWLQQLLNETEANSTLFNFCKTLIEITLPLNYDHPKILLLLFKMETPTKRIDDFIMENLSQLDEDCGNQFLRNLSLTALEHTLSHFQNSESIEWYGDIAQALIENEEDPKKRILIMETILKSIFIDSISDFCEHLINIDQEEDDDAILWLLPAISKIHLEKFCQLDIEQRDDILMRSLPKKSENFSTIFAHFDLETTNTLLKNMLLKHVSQDHKNQAHATFTDILNYLENSTEDYMSVFSSDFKEIPPILIALGLTFEDYTDTILSTVSFMSKHQILGMCHVLNLFFSINTIDKMIEHGINLDDYEQVLTFITDSNLSHLLCSREIEIKAIDEQSKLFSKVYINFTEAFKKLQHRLTQEEYQNTVSLYHKANLLLVKIVDQYNRKLLFAAKRLQIPYYTQIANQIEKNVEILKLFKDQKNGYLPQLQKLKPSQEQKTTDQWKEKLKMHEPFILRYSIQKFERMGIITDDDVLCLTSDLENKNLVDILRSYIEQYDHMEKLWSFFREKHGINSLSGLVELAIIQKEEAGNLIEIAIKMGYKNDSV